jgi:hypothetical protein
VSRKSGYCSCPYAAPPDDMRQLAPSTTLRQPESSDFDSYRRPLTDEDLARNITAGIREEVDRRIGDIADGAETAERLGFGVCFFYIRGEEAVETLCMLDIQFVTTDEGHVPLWKRLAPEQ